MSDFQQATGNGGAGPEDGAEPAVRMQIVGQYVKDLSFENPGAPFSFTQRPQIDLGIDVQARRLDPERYEVEIKLRISAKADDKPAFMLELLYAGLFFIQNVPEDLLQQLLLIEAPQLLFPFARRIVSDAVRDGGMPPLMIEPIDFSALYRAKQGELAARTNPPAQT